MGYREMKRAKARFIFLFEGEVRVYINKNSPRVSLTLRKFLREGPKVEILFTKVMKDRHK